MKKIGIVCNRFGLSGGMESYALDIVRSLIRQGSRPVIFTRKADKSLPEYSLCDIYENPLTLWPGKLRDAAFSRWVRKMRHISEIDELWACSRCVGADVFICGGTHKGFVMSVRGEGNATFFDRFNIHMEEQAFASAKIIVAHSAKMEKELTDLYGVEEKKICTLFPPCDKKRFTLVSQCERQVLRDKLGFSRDKVLFLFASSSHERKGFPFLKQFFTSTKLPIELVVCGRNVPDGLKNIRNFGYSDHIEDLYRACDATILASLYEPFGLVSVEGVLCGASAVIADNIGCNEAISHRAKFVFQEKNVDSLREAIQNVLKRSDRTSEADILYDLDIDVHTKKLLALL